MSNGKQVVHEYVLPEYVIERDQNEQRFSCDEILSDIDDGKLKQARQKLLQNIIIGVALGTVLDWINHPEYVVIVRYDEQGRTATVRYRECEYDLEF